MNLRTLATHALALLKPGALSTTPIGTDGIPAPGTVTPLALQPKWLRDLAGSSGDYRINLVVPVMQYTVVGEVDDNVTIYRPFKNPVQAANELDRLRKKHDKSSLDIKPRRIGSDYRKVDEFSGTFEEAVNRVEHRKLLLRETGMAQSLYVEFAVEDKRTTKILYTTQTEQEVIARADKAA